jgi:hypothetical protein
LNVFSQTDSTEYILKVRLTKAQHHPPDCGIFAWALAQKFEVAESNLTEIKPSAFVLLNEPCPEFLGYNFFITSKLYKVWVTKKNRAPFTYMVISDYKKEKLPVFWIQKIELVNN